MKKTAIILLFLFSYACTTVTDSVVTSIDEEQYKKVDLILYNIEDYRINYNSNALERAISDLKQIDLETIYNNDYKGKILGLLAITEYYSGNILKAKTIIKDLEIINKDEELYWVALSLTNEDEELNILLEAKEAIFETEILNYYLADALLKNEEYGQAADLYDSIILAEPDFLPYYERQREIAYNFFKNPPSNFKSGSIYIKNKISFNDLIDIIKIETPYFTHINEEDVITDLNNRGYFFNSIETANDLYRKDLSYFLFKLINEKRKNLNLMDNYNEFYIESPSEAEKIELEGLSPILDIPIYIYYFFPALYLIEEEIMELPDGEIFYPEENVSGKDLQRIVSNLKNRLD